MLVKSQLIEIANNLNITVDEKTGIINITRENKSYLQIETDIEGLNAKDIDEWTGDNLIDISLYFSANKNFTVELFAVNEKGQTQTGYSVLVDNSNIQFI